MDQPRNLLSVGIDIGTTTTQLVFSSLALMDVARPGQIPRINITDRKVLFQSEIIFTPLLDDETVDVKQLIAFIQQQYDLAGVLPSQVETGAAIITGETAKKKNADEILKAAANWAGDFVVTVAGPNVESAAAGRGSGAAEYSRQHFNTIINVDIGGGSANSAVFKQGKLTAAAAMNFGGRIIEFDPVSGTVKKISKPGLIICQQAGVFIHPGSTIDMESLVRICDTMCHLTVELIEGTCSPLAEKLYLTNPMEVTGRNKLVMLSGGIGRCYFDDLPASNIQETAVYGDIGPLFARRLRNSGILDDYTFIQPPETMRATVLGAASQLITLSGSTIWAEKGILPLRNVPVVRPALDGLPGPDELPKLIARALTRWDIRVDENPFAVALDIDRVLDYQALVRLTEGLRMFSEQYPSNQPLIVIIQKDYAQSLGQTLRTMLTSRPLLVIDQVGLEEGDYLDIGSPLMDGRVVPLTVKTLVFYHHA